MEKLEYESFIKNLNFQHQFKKPSKYIIFMKIEYNKLTILNFSLYKFYNLKSNLWSQRFHIIEMHYYYIEKIQINTWNSRQRYLFDWSNQTILSFLCEYGSVRACEVILKLTLVWLCIAVIVKKKSELLTLVVMVQHKIQEKVKQVADFLSELIRRYVILYYYIDFSICELRFWKLHNNQISSFIFLSLIKDFTPKNINF